MLPNQTHGTATCPKCDSQDVVGMELIEANSDCGVYWCCCGLVFVIDNSSQAQVYNFYDSTVPPN